MRRRHAIEFHDHDACPEPLRESIVESLGLALRWGRVYDNVAPVFAEFCERAEVEAVLDLGSGSGEPVSVIVDGLTRQGISPPRFATSDLFPNVAVMERTAARHPEFMEVIGTSVDATDVPEEVDRPARSIISAFHHFTPSLAAQILADCVEKGRAVFILEGSPRSLPRMVPMLGPLLAAGLANPLIAERHRAAKAALTYLVPVVETVGIWDGVVSVFRVYSEDELRDMAAAAGGSYEWHYRKVPYGFGGQAVVFYGMPADR